ncbi:phosphoglycerate mutase domain-containing protein [Cryptosporidium ubiquitum]|uniref:Phosphoglycerate mutase domain-containing protein n=1 Tax=Cryptosporidium ubiquitum TaxID=857276 RepID=A0A1J4MGM6_9CRYT|nr:phosphoglycerate mutase domain-containing protein [Cryptosporidium ubiquitum]OII73352.1 phosphoglycerate mutase domain-containing protein [Cryptosporidium ubiquitum]
MWFFIRHAESANNATNNNDSTDSGEKYNDERVPDPSLTELGYIQAEKTGLYLASKSVKVWKQEREDQKSMSLENPNFKAIYCSPMQRSLETADKIQKILGVPVFVNPDLCEVGGVFRGKRHTNSPRESKEVCSGKKRSVIMKEFPNFQLDERITEQGWWGKPQETFKEASERAKKVAELLWEISYEDLKKTGTEYQGNTNILISHGLFQDMLMKRLFMQRNPVPTLEESAIFPCENCAISQIALYDHTIRQFENISEENTQHCHHKSQNKQDPRRVCICIKWNSSHHLEDCERTTTRTYPNSKYTHQSANSSSNSS